MFSAPRPPFPCDPLEDVRDLIHRLEEVVRRLVVRVSRLNLTHGEEQTFHLHPELVTGAGEGRLEDTDIGWELKLR